MGPPPSGTTPYIPTRKRQPRKTAPGWVSRMLAKPMLNALVTGLCSQCSCPPLPLQQQPHTGQPRFPGVASILKQPGSWATTSTAFHKPQENGTDLGAAYPPTQQEKAWAGRHIQGVGPRCTQGSCLISDTSGSLVLHCPA